MHLRRIALRRLLLPCFLTLAAPTLATETPWSQLELTGRKLFVEAKVTLRAEVVSSGSVRNRLVQDPEHAALNAARRTLRMTTETELLGRRTSIETLLRVHSLAALQRDLLETGSRNRRKTYRFGPFAVLALRAEPSSAQEKELDVTAWTRRSRQLLALPGHPAEEDDGVTDPVALLLAASALPLEDLQIGIERTVLSGNRFHTARLRLIEEADQEVELLVDGQRLEGSRPVQRFEISSRDGDSLEMLGLSGTMVLEVDRATRIPLRLQGKVPMIGRVSMNVRSAKRR